MEPVKVNIVCDLAAFLAALKLARSQAAAFSQRLDEKSREQ